MATGVSYHFAWLLLVLVSLSSGERSRAVRERGRNSGSADRLQKEFKRLKRDLQRLTTRVNSLGTAGHSVHFTVSNPTGVSSLTPNVSESKVYNIWTPSYQPQENNEIFHMADSAEVKILQPGTYLIYAQITYYDPAGRNSFGIYVNNNSDPVAQCLIYDPILSEGTAIHQYHQCSTLIVRQLQKNTLVRLQALYTERNILTRPSLTYWGLVRLG